MNQEFSDDKFSKPQSFILRTLPPIEGSVPPHSSESEAQVIGACLVDGNTTLERCLRERLQPDAFYSPANRMIFTTMVKLRQAKRECTIDVLAEELRSQQLLGGVGGFNYLVEITSKVPTTATAGYFIDQVREKWVLRKLALFGRELAEEVNSHKGNLEEFTARHALRLQRVADFVIRLNRPDAAAEAAASKVVLMEILAGNVDKTRQLSLGTPYSDRMLLPLDVKNEDWLVIVCGPPSGGKSSYMRQVVTENAKAGKRGMVFLLETGKRRWLWAAAASQAALNLRQVMEEPKSIPPDKMKNFVDWDEAISGWLGERLWLHDDIFNLEDIERTMREMDRSLREKDLAAGVAPELAHGLDYVVIDYLQLMVTREKILKREEYVSHLSRNLKRLFKTLNVSGVVGAQLNRKSRDEERRPRLSDLRESGAIEQDADCVLAVHTPAEDRSGTLQDGERTVHEVELIQLKRRNGPNNVAVDLNFFKAQTRFQDAAHRGDPRPGAPKPSTGYKRKDEK